MALTDNLISWWSLDEASGTRVDSHGSKDLTDNNTVGSTTGKIGNAARFIGANSEYLSSTDSAFLNQGAFSVAFWLYYPTVATTYSFIVGLGGSSYRWGITGTSGGEARLDHGGFASTGLDTGAWNFITATVDTSTFSLILYKNGSSAAPGFAIGVSSVDQLRIGDTRTANADIDECAFWNRVLTPTEVTELYNSGNGLSYADIAGGGGGDLVLKRRKMYHHLTQMGT